MNEKIKLSMVKLKISRNKSITHIFCLLEKIKNNENIVGQRAKRAETSKIARKYKNINIKQDNKS